MSLLTENLQGWITEKKETVLTTRIFDIEKKLCYRTNASLEKRKNIAKKDLVEFHTIHSKDFVQCIPLIYQNNQVHVVLISQYRYGTEDFVLEFPGGIIDDGEDPQKAVFRELQEETGYKAKSCTFLQSIYANPAIFNNSCHIYIAEKLTNTGYKNLDKHEDTNVSVMPLQQLLQEKEKLNFKHGLMFAGLYFLLDYLTFKASKYN